MVRKRPLGRTGQKHRKQRVKVEDATPEGTEIEELQPCELQYEQVEPLKEVKQVLDRVWG